MAQKFDPDVMKLFDGYVHGKISRRQFLDRAAKIATVGASAGAVLASLLPDYSLAQQVDPADKSIMTDYKKYSSPDGGGVMNGYFARPATFDHRLPGVVVVHENRGLNPYIEDVARRLAVAGFIGFAPDALTPLGGYPGNDDDGRKMQRQRDRNEMVADFKAALAFIADHPDCSGNVGVVGFCFGGGMVMRLAVDVPSLGAGIAFYASHPDASEAAGIVAPLMIHHAELDERVNASWPEFEAGLKKANKKYVNFEYAGTNHGFHNDTTPRYDEASAELAWQRTVDFFEEHLSQEG